jgi:hypothetical protein
VKKLEAYPGLENRFGMLWRFAPLADDFVFEWHSRDLDSQILPREVAAVEDWKKTNFTFHIMRDNPAHGTNIMGGMFGVRQESPEKKKRRKEEFDQMIKEYGQGWTKGRDQIALAIVVTPSAFNDSLVHDSYLCRSEFYMRGAKSAPFPTQRVSGPNFTLPDPVEPNFVGNTGNYAINEKCPVECRPENHKDWILC